MTTTNTTQSHEHTAQYTDACNQYHRDIFIAEEYIDSGHHDEALMLLNSIQSRDLLFLEGQERPDLHLMGYIKALKTCLPTGVSIENQNELYKMINPVKNNSSFAGQVVNGFIFGIIDKIDSLNAITININSFSVAK